MRRGAATRRGRRCPHVRPHRATWIPRVFSQLAPTRLRLGPIGADSSLNRPKQTIQAGEKKKMMQNAPFDLYLNPTSAQFTQPPKHKLSPLLTFRLSLHLSLCSLPLFHLPCGCETLSHSALTQFTTSIHSFFSSPLIIFYLVLISNL